MPELPNPIISNKSSQTQTNLLTGRRGERTLRRTMEAIEEEEEEEEEDDQENGIQDNLFRPLEQQMSLEHQYSQFIFKTSTYITL